MELFFNLLWLLIALASFAQWRRVVRLRHAARSRVKAALPLVALVCALAILFPSISVTDNLHPGLFTTEDGSRSRRAMAAMAGAAHAAMGHPSQASPPALITSPVQPYKFESAVAKLYFATCSALPATLARSLPSRAPPSL
jgi:hypothetical protein